MKTLRTAFGGAKAVFIWLAIILVVATSVGLWLMSHGHSRGAAFAADLRDSTSSGTAIPSLFYGVSSSLRNQTRLELQKSYWHFNAETLATARKNHVYYCADRHRSPNWMERTRATIDRWFDAPAVHAQSCSLLTSGPNDCTPYDAPECQDSVSNICVQPGWQNCVDTSNGCGCPGASVANCPCPGSPDYVCPNEGTPQCVKTAWGGCPGGVQGCPISEAGQWGENCALQGQTASCQPPWGCVGGSPIIIDAKGQGFHLTGLGRGVVFSFSRWGPPVHISWTDPVYANGFLVLDRNGDGIINNGTELFGNLTPQPPSKHPNGFAALAVFDQPQQGWNGNGWIDPGDAVFARLRIWIDQNHNGVSEPGELHSLPDLGVQGISLNYGEADYTDSFGNRFRFKSRIRDSAGAEHDACYDVFLQIAP